MAQVSNWTHLTGHRHPSSSGSWPPERPRSVCQQWAHTAERNRCHPASLAASGREKFNQGHHF